MTDLLQTNQQLTEQVEADLLQEVIANMTDSKISMDQAQKLATDFLALLPVEDKKDLLEKLQNLGKAYPEAQAVFIKYAQSEEESTRQRKLDAMATHIKAGSVDQALRVAKGE